MVGVGILGVFRLTADESGRLDLLRQAVAAAATDEEVNVAVLAGNGSTAAAFGYAVFPDDEDGFIVIDGLAVPPDGKGLSALVSGRWRARVGWPAGRR